MASPACSRKGTTKYSAPRKRSSGDDEGRRRVSIPVLYPMFTGYIFVGGRFLPRTDGREHITAAVGFPDEFGRRRLHQGSLNLKWRSLREMSGGLIPHRRSVTRIVRSALVRWQRSASGLSQDRSSRSKEAFYGHKAKIFVSLFRTRYTDGDTDWRFGGRVNPDKPPRNTQHVWRQIRERFQKAAERPLKRSSASRSTGQ